jgi:fatty aldehyde decarbonylase
MPQLEAIPDIDFHSDTYKNAYSRINAIVIEGERQAFERYRRLSDLLPDHHETFVRLCEMEKQHEQSFQACGRNLQVTPDTDFARQCFAPLHQNFQTAAEQGKVVTCLAIQSLIVECFAIAAFNSYIPVADPFARQTTERVIDEKYDRVNFGEQWLQAHFEASKAEIEQANAQNLPLVWQLLDRLKADAETLGMEQEALVEEFTIAYGELLGNIGFETREIMRMWTYGLDGV